jgi:hypothetical protein
MSQHVLRSLNRKEAERVAVLQERIAALPEADQTHPSIVQFEIWTDSSKAKSFMLMPALRGTLEPILRLSEEMSTKRCDQISSAPKYVPFLRWTP